MYEIVRTKLFEKSYRKLKRSGLFKEQARGRLETVVALLIDGRKLPPHVRDHQLEGDLKRYRECHIGGDMLLVYWIDSVTEHVFLVDMGDHPHVFGD